MVDHAPDVRHANAPFVRTADTWLGYSLLAYFSFFVNALGPLMPFLRAELTLSYTLASLHFSAFAGARVLTGLFSDRLILRFGRQRIAWAGVLGAAAGAAVLMLGRRAELTIAGAGIMGALGAAIPVIVQAALADRHGPMRAVAFAEANAIASASGMLGPLFIGFLARTALGWRTGLVLAIVAPLPLYAAFRRVTLPGAPRRLRQAKGSGGGRLPAAFWAYWVVMLLVVATEFCIIYWSSAFLEQVKGLARPDAALSTSIFLAGMFAGRLLGSRIMRRTQSARVLLLSLALAGCGFLLHWLGRSVPLTEGGLLLAGLGVANLYPLALTFAMGIVPQQLDAASARASLAVAVAILCLPLLLGRLADVAGLQSAYGLVAVLLGLALIAVPAAGWLESALSRLSLTSLKPRKP